jgi:phosphatidylglycerol:prolipoprotein diacylglycerol transferase
VQPVLFTIPGLNLAVPAFGVMLMAGLLLGVIWAANRAQKSGANPDIVLNCAFIALVGGVLGCRIMYVIHYWERDFAIYDDPIRTAWAVLNITRGGLEYYGGFILAIGVIIGYLVIWKHSLRWYLDIMAPSAALGLAIGRIGCLLNGCCWGGVCDAPYAIRFPYGSNPSVMQWRAAEAGSELREELIYFNSVGLAQPIGREALEAGDADLEAAAQAHRISRQVRAATADFERATDPARKKEIRTRLDTLGADLRKARAAAKPPGHVGCAGGSAAADQAYDDVLTQMEKYGVTPAQLRQWSHASLPVHASQLYSTVTALLLALTLNAWYYRRTRDGQVICLLLIMEPVTRYLLEIIRADNPLDTFSFTISQFLAIMITLCGIVGMIALRWLPRRSPRARIWEPPPQPAEKQKNTRTAPAS